jgi:hypothetical protein
MELGDTLRLMVGAGVLPPLVPVEAPLLLPPHPVNARTQQNRAGKRRTAEYGWVMCTTGSQWLTTIRKQSFSRVGNLLNSLRKFRI